MITKSEQTVCILCGNLRVFSRKWKEQVDGRGSVVTHFESVCSDSECQKKVDAKFAEMREKREMADERRKGIVIAKRVKTPGILLK